MEKPDETLYQEQIKEEQKAINRIRDELEECAKTIRSLNEAKEKQHADFFKRKDILSRIQSQIQQLLDQKTAIHHALDVKRQQKQAAEVPAASKKQQQTSAVPGVRSQSSIDTEIAQIEREMMTSTLSLKDEKRLIAKIDSLMLQKTDNLKASGKTSTASAKEQNKEDIAASVTTPTFEFDEQEITTLKTKLEEVDVGLNELRKKRNQEYQKMSERPANENVGSLIEEAIKKRDELRAQMKKHQEKKNMIYNTMKGELQTYNEALAKHQQEAQQKLREEKMKMQIESQRITLEKRLEAAEKVPMNASLQILKQLRNLVQKYFDDRNNRDPNFLARKVQQQSGENAVSSETDSSAGGYSPEESNSKASGKMRSFGKKEKATVLRYDLQTLSYFDQCGVSAPLREIDLDNCLAEIDCKIASKQAEFDSILKEKELKKKALLEELSTLEAKQAENAGTSP